MWQIAKKSFQWEGCKTLPFPLLVASVVLEEGETSSREAAAPPSTAAREFDFAAWLCKPLPDNISAPETFGEKKKTTPWNHHEIIWLTTQKWRGDIEVRKSPTSLHFWHFLMQWCSDICEMYCFCIGRDQLRPTPASGLFVLDQGCCLPCWGCILQHAFQAAVAMFLLTPVPAGLD